MLRGITPKSVLEHLLFAVIGGVMYMLIEIAWRGYTHWSMGVLGGVCFVAVGLLNEIQQRPPIILQMAQGAVICTVRDYSGVPGNIMGQVCPQFMFAWAALSAVAVWVEDRLHKIFD